MMFNFFSMQVDAIIFSAGIGENSSIIRGLICSGLEAMGLVLDEARNEDTVGGKQADISSTGSKIKVRIYLSCICSLSLSRYNPYYTCKFTCMLDMCLPANASF